MFLRSCVAFYCGPIVLRFFEGVTSPHVYTIEYDCIRSICPQTSAFGGITAMIIVLTCPRHFSQYSFSSVIVKNNSLGDITEIPMLSTTKLTHIAATVFTSFALAMPLTAMAENPFLNTPVTPDNPGGAGTGTQPSTTSTTPGTGTTPTNPGGAPDWSTPNTGGPLSNPRPTPPEAKPLLKANLKPNLCVTRPEAFKGCAVYN